MSRKFEPDLTPPPSPLCHIKMTVSLTTFYWVSHNSIPPCPLLAWRHLWMIPCDWTFHKLVVRCKRSYRIGPMPLKITFSLSWKWIHPSWLVPSIFTDWKFYLNLAGSEMPLMSIESMSKVLKNASSSIIDSFPLPNKNRLEKVVQLKRLLVKFFWFYL